METMMIRVKGLNWLAAVPELCERPAKAQHNIFFRFLPEPRYQRSWHLSVDSSYLAIQHTSQRTSVKMENYRRQPRSITEEEQNYGLLQHAENEIIISNSGKINRYVTVGLELLEKNGTIVVVGSGKAVSKTVSVAEIIKRKMEGSLHQYTQIGSSTATEKWDPVEGKDFSQLVVSKHIPVLTIYLCQEASPALEKVSGYQAPTKEAGDSK